MYWNTGITGNTRSSKYSVADMIVAYLQVRILVLHRCSEVVSFPFSFFKRGTRESPFFFLKHFETLSVKFEDYNKFIFLIFAYKKIINFCLGFYSYNNYNLLFYNLKTMYLKSSNYTAVYLSSWLISECFQILVLLIVQVCRQTFLFPVAKT